MSKLLDLLVLIFFQCVFLASINAQYSPPCAEGDSLFSKRDLIQLINRNFDVELKIWSHIHKAFNTTAQSVRDEVLKGFNDRLSNFEAQPIPKIQEILAELDTSLKTEVTRQAQVAAATLQNIPSREEALNEVSDKVKRLYAELDKSTMICKLNECKKTPVAVHTRGRFISGELKTKQRNTTEYMCGDIEVVMSTITEELLLFEATEIEKLNISILHGKNMLNENIFILMELLRADIDKAFGPTMYDVLYLQDEHVTYKQTLEDFNNESYNEAFDKLTMRLNSQLIDLNRGAKKFRQYCLTCNTKFSRADMPDVRKQTGQREYVTADYENVPPPTLLERLLAEKFQSIDTTIEAAIHDMLYNLTEIINENDLVEKTIAKLEPLEKEISNHVQIEQKKIEDLKKLAPKDSLDQVRDFYLASVRLSQMVAQVIFMLEQTMPK